MTTEVLGDDAEQQLPDHSVVGDYRLVQQLGEGGMGVVHLALDRSGRAVALKVLRPHIAHDPNARARLAREVQTLSRITDPGVAPVLDADIDGERPFIVTRYVPGPALDDVVRRDGPLDGADLLRLGRGLAKALEAIHAAGVVHRDVKPGNVLLLDGEPVLIDFGIAHIADDIRLTSTGLVMGTPGYLSPELVEGAEVTEATDWWGWAATVAFAALGRAPFGTGPMDVILNRVTRGEANLDGVNPRLAPLLGAALSPDPALRPDVTEVLAGLEAYAAGRSATEAIDVSHRQAATRVLPVGSTPATASEGPPRAAVTASAPVVAPDWPEPPVTPYGDQGDGALTTLGGVPHADPRIGRPNRTGTLLALLTLVVAGAVLIPLATVLVVLVGAAVARTADRSMTSLILRRHANGVRRSDLPLAVVASPWHLVVGVLGSLLAAVVPLLVAVTSVFSAAMAMAAATGGSAQPWAPAPLAVGALFGCWIAWWGPGGASLRRGTRSLVRGVTGSPAVQQSVVALLLLATLAILALAATRGWDPSWWPRSGPFDLAALNPPWAG